MDIKKSIRKVSALVLFGFGMISLFLSTSIILDLFGIRAKEGNYVLFIVWANFICSLIYIFSAYGFLKIKTWTATVLSIGAVILIIGFVFLQLHINDGGIYETKTVGAMIFRICITIAFALIAYFTINKNDSKTPI